MVLAIGGYGVYSAMGSSGPVIPDIPANSELTQTYSALRALGLRVAVVFINRRTLNVSYESPAKVEHMWPAPGTRVRRGDVVTLVADSQGLASSIVTEPNPHYRVPDFVGRPAAAAMRWSGKHRIYWDIPKLPSLAVGNPAYQLYDAYRVTAQDPKPGSIMGRWHGTPSGGYDHSWLKLTVRPRR